MATDMGGFSRPRQYANPRGGGIPVTPDNIASKDIRGLPAAQHDPYFLGNVKVGATDAGDRTVLLLHFDELNGSTTSTSKDRTAKIATASGNALITTAQSVFGGASMSPGTGVFNVAGSIDFDFAAGDFTVEAFVYQNTNATLQRICLYANGTALNSNFSWSLATNVGGALRGDIITGEAQVTPTSGVVPTKTWTHVALVVYKGVAYTFTGGKPGAGIAAGAANTLTSATLRIGAFPNSTQNFDGYIDEVRITRGVARYTTDFTPPIRAFPDF